MKKRKTQRPSERKKLPCLPPELWYSLAWSAANPDAIKALTGVTPCTTKQWKELQQSLYEQQKYDLFAITIYRDQKTANIELPPKQKTKASKRGMEIYDKVIHGQLTTFWRWCNPEEREILTNQGPFFDMFRLSYIALFVGYNELAFSIISKLTRENMEEIGLFLKSRPVNVQLLHLKWRRDFHKQQTDTNLRKRLIKRMITYGPPFLFSSPELDSVKMRSII